MIYANFLWFVYIDIVFLWDNPMNMKRFDTTTKAMVVKNRQASLSTRVLNHAWKSLSHCEKTYELFFHSQRTCLVWATIDTNGPRKSQCDLAMAHLRDQGGISIQRCRLTSIGIPILKTRRSHRPSYLWHGNLHTWKKTVFISRWGPEGEPKLDFWTSSYSVHKLYTTVKRMDK